MNPATLRGAARRRKATFSWTQPVVLTHRCAFHCDYCPYPSTAGSPLPSIGRLKESIAVAHRLGLRQVRLTGGEGVENHSEIVSTFRHYGYRTWAEYLKAVLGEIARNSARPPLFPEIDLGAMPFFHMNRLRPFIFTLRIYLDSMDARLQSAPPHARSRGKWPRARLGAILSAGRLGIPINSGLMVGIGESAESRRRALETLAKIAARHGHVQSVAIHPFEPRARTAMSAHPRPSNDLLLEVTAMARRILPRGVVVQVPMAGRPERALEFIEAGAEDFGDFELTGDPAADGPTLNAFRVVRDRLDERGIALADRLSVFPRFARAKWLTPRYRELLSGLTRANGRAA